jgi:hypothetical protein
MVGARLPEHVAAAHALEAHENVLDGVVERMPHVQRARDVGRRNDDGIGLGLGLAARLEIAALLPAIIEAGFHLVGMMA